MKNKTPPCPLAIRFKKISAIFYVQVVEQWFFSSNFYINSSNYNVYLPDLLKRYKHQETSHLNFTEVNDVYDVDDVNTIPEYSLISHLINSTNIKNIIILSSSHPEFTINSHNNVINLFVRGISRNLDFTLVAMNDLWSYRAFTRKVIIRVLNLAVDLYNNSIIEFYGSDWIKIAKKYFNNS